MASNPEVVFDQDNPEWTAEDFARAQGPEFLPADVLASFPATVRRVRGKQKSPVKAQVTLRLDPDVLDYFRSKGPGWQSRINAALRSKIDKGAA